MTREGRIAGGEAALIFSGSFSSSGETTGNSGSVVLSSDEISNLSVITLASGGRSGNVDIRSLDNGLTVSDLSVITTAQVDIPNPRFPDQTISLDLRNIGQSGNTSLRSPRDIVLNNVNIQGDANGSQAAGNITITSPEQVTFNNSQISSNTLSSGAAGNIVIEAARLNLGEGARLSATTSATGTAGDITFNIADALTIDGSTVESRTTPGSEGNGGNINVLNAGSTALSNGGRFSLNSEGAGTGGNFGLTAGSLTLNSSNITAITNNTNGGDFTLSIKDYLLLRNGSLISTEAGTAGAGGNGGSISINIPNGFVIAVSAEYSDIRANAFEGNGGNVSITARNLLGIAFRPGLSDTPASDITSSSQFGNSGSVTIDELNSEALQPDINLPQETAPATVARGCRAQGAQTGSFVSTGRGGLPASPVAPLSASTIWQDIDPVEASVASRSQPHPRLTQPDELALRASAEAPIAEAQTWYRTADGTVILGTPSTESLAYFSQIGECDT